MEGSSTGGGDTAGGACDLYCNPPPEGDWDTVASQNTEPVPQNVQKGVIWFEPYFLLTYSGVFVINPPGSNR